MMMALFSGRGPQKLLKKSERTSNDADAAGMATWAGVPGPPVADHGASQLDPAGVCPTPAQVFQAGSLTLV